MFDIGAGRVLRRYRRDKDTTREAATMTHLASHGYPVPTVHDAQGRDLVMDRIDGPTMLGRMTSKPWQLRGHARSLAQLHRDLASVPVDGLRLDGASGEASVIVHGDLHPENVMLAPQGPVVIDWTGAHFGRPGADTAVVWALMHAAEAPVRGLERLVVAAGRRALLRAFLAASDEDAARRALAEMVERRQHDANLSDSEKAKMRALLD